MWLYIALNRTANTDCYWVGAVPNLNPSMSLVLDFFVSRMPKLQAEYPKGLAFRNASEVSSPVAGV